MKIKTIICVLIIPFISTYANAQEKSTSISIGISPWGYSHSFIKGNNSEKYVYDFKSVMNANICLEKQFKGITTLAELSYTQGKFKEYDLNGTTTLFDPAQQEDLIDATFTIYAGLTINPNKRIQFPIYLGLSGGYLKGGAIHNFMGGGAAKARIKFYITNNIGIYAGVTGHYMLGSRKMTMGQNTIFMTYSLPLTLVLL